AIMSSQAVVLVTGSSRGLGRGVALCCASAGFSVAIHYAGNREAAEKTKADCEERASVAGQRVHLVQGNLSEAADRQRLFDGTVEHFGRLDALVNNAGMAPRVRNDITEATEESYDEVMGVNLKGPYFLSQLAARYWLQNPGKSLIPG